MIITLPRLSCYLGQDIDKCQLFQKANVILYGQNKVKLVYGMLVQKLIKKDLTLITLENTSKTMKCLDLAIPNGFEFEQHQDDKQAMERHKNGIIAFDWTCGWLDPKEIFPIRIFNNPETAIECFNGIKSGLNQHLKEELDSLLANRSIQLVQIQKEIESLTSFRNQF